MGLIARGDLQGRRLHFGEAARLEPAAHGPANAPARLEKRPAIQMGLGSRQEDVEEVFKGRDVAGWRIGV